MSYEHRDMVSSFDHEDKPTYRELTRSEYIKEHLDTLSMACDKCVDLLTMIRALHNLQHTLLTWVAQDRRDERLARGEKK